MKYWRNVCGVEETWFFPVSGLGLLLLPLEHWTLCDGMTAITLADAFLFILIFHRCKILDYEWKATGSQACNLQKEQKLCTSQARNKYIWKALPMKAALFVFQLKTSLLNISAVSSLLSDEESTLIGQLLTLYLRESLTQWNLVASRGLLYVWYKFPWLVCCEASVLLAVGPY